MKVLLHICCGVCAAGAAGVLVAEGHKVTGFFYNPNIFPEAEYLARLEAARKTAAQLGFELLDGDYEQSFWQALAAPLKDEPEGGRRCAACYRIRLERTFQTALQRGLEAFTSTLTISPHKSSAMINAIGADIGGAMFMARDFKKKDGFRKATELAGRWGLYRQDYCGCLYSLEARRRPAY